MLPKCFQRCRPSIVSAATAGDIGCGNGITATYPDLDSELLAL